MAESPPHGAAALGGGGSVAVASADRMEELPPARHFLSK